MSKTSFQVSKIVRCWFRDLFVIGEKASLEACGVILSAIGVHPPAITTSVSVATQHGSTRMVLIVSDSQASLVFKSNTSTVLSKSETIIVSVMVYFEPPAA